MGPLKIAVVCEDAPDQRTACRLADRVVCEGVDPVEEEKLSSLRAWCGADQSASFLAWKHVRRTVEELGVKAHGHFAGEPGGPDARIARLALLALGRLHPDLGAALLMRDADQQESRRAGLCQARDCASRPFPVIIGLAVTKRECWLLAAFEPDDDAEQERLRSLRAELGFNPCEKSEQLTAADEQAKRSAKRVLRYLCEGDRDRAEHGIDTTPLATLQKRGRDNGLADYLADLESRLVPVFKSHG